MPIPDRGADHGEGTALALADVLKQSARGRRDREHVALLRLVAPDLARRKARVFHRDRAQLDARTPARGVDELRKGVGQAARPHVVDREDRIRLAELPAAVDHLLRAAFHLGVVALHGIEVEVGDVRTGAHGRGGAAAHADEQTRSAELDEQRTRLERALGRVLRAQRTQPAGQHDGLVVAARAHLEGAEVAAQVGAAELVVERRGPDRRLEHDVERRGDALGAAGALAFPRLHGAGDAQVGHRVADQAGLGLRAAAGRAFVADFAARAGRRTGKWRNGRRVVMRLALDDEVRLFLARCIDARRTGEEPPRARTLDDRGVVGVRHHGPLRVRSVGVADHGEQGLRLPLAVDDPFGVEDLVAAVLGIRLREHRELGVGRIAPEPAIGVLQVFDLVSAQGETQGLIRLPDAGDRLKRPRRNVLEQALRLLEGPQHRLGHAIVQQARHLRVRRAHIVGRAALDPARRDEAAVACDVGGLGRPRRERAQARHHEVKLAPQRFEHRRAVVEQALQHLALGRGELVLGLDEVAVLRAYGTEAGVELLQRGDELGEAELRQGTRPAELEDLRH